MAAEVVMPKMGYDMTEGTVLRWLKSEGDAVFQGEILGEIETGKVNIEIEAFDGGVLHRILVAEGETVDVGTPIAIIAAAGEDPVEIAAADGLAGSAPESGVPTKNVAAADTGAVSAPQRGSTARPDTGSDVNAASGRRLRASPLARRLASEHGLDLADLAGSGPSGRIVRDDVLAAVAGAAVPDGRKLATAQAGADRPLELSRMRATIARRLTGSWTAAPHIFLTMPIDVTDALALRQQINAVLADRGESKVSINDLVLKAAALSLRKHPELNSSWLDGSRVDHDRVHLGVAVALDDGLSTITVPDADSIGLAEIAATVADRSERARQGVLSAADVATASTFTVSNLGMYGVEEFTAILNPPEAGILAVGAAIPAPVVVEAEIVVRDVMRVTLSADHRVVDGAVAADFLATLRQVLESPMGLLV